MAEESETLEETRATIENTLRNLQNAKQFAFDIGSSLVKIAYSSSVSKTKTNYDRTVATYVIARLLHSIFLYALLSFKGTPFS